MKFIYSYGMKNMNFNYIILSFVLYEKIFVKKYKSYNMFYMLNKIYIF